MDAAITVIRGIVLSAERAWELTEAATAAGGEDNFDDVLAADSKLTYEAPISRLEANYAGAGNDVVVVGAPLGMRTNHEFAVLRIDGLEPTLFDGYTGEPKKPIRCKLSDAEIVTELNKCGIPCTEDDLGSFVVVWTGYS